MVVLKNLFTYSYYRVSKDYLISNIYSSIPLRNFLWYLLKNYFIKLGDFLSFSGLFLEERD